MELALTVVFAFALGASVASFLNVVADRLPAGESLISPPSHCPVDHHVLAWYENVPVLTYLIQRGRCRGECNARIPLRLVLVEVMGGAMFAAVGWQYGVSLDALLLVVAFSFLLVIAIIDLEHKLVLNKVLIAAYPAALVSAPLWSEDLRDAAWDIGPRAVGQVVDASAAGAVGFLTLLVIALVSRGMGGGDVKLIGAIGLWVGLRQLPVALFIAVVFGGIVAIILLLIRRSGRKDAIPFAPFLCTGAVIALIWGETLGTWYLDLLTP